MQLPLILLVFYHIRLTYCHRFKRFLNSEVNNRIDVLQQSHEDHRDETNWLRIVLFATVGAFAVISLTLFLITIFLCRRIRRDRKSVV